MIGKALSTAVIGIDAKLINVEVDIKPSQLPNLIIVGLPDKSVQEARERITAAIKNSGFEWPRKKIIVNLAPADIPKFGTSFDLPIAIAILSASNQLEFDFEKYIFVGELSLDGVLRPIPGVLPITIEGKKLNIKNIIVPEENSSEAGLVKGINVFGAKSIAEIFLHLTGEKKLDCIKTKFDDILLNQTEEINFDYIKGQDSAKRAAVISAAGGHNLLLSGSPGSGKTLISRAISSILPKLTFEEALEITKIYSVANLLQNRQALISSRPFRSPHHTASTTSIIGGGKFPKPGELSLAHRGILFLDELTEFSPFTMEALRQPLEDRKVVVSRVSGTLTFPANFMLVAAMNPCKCGWKGDDERECTCTPYIIEKYKRKISGPILDRIDLQVSVSRVKIGDLTNSSVLQNSIASVIMRDKVQKARNIQLNRFINTNVFCNSEIPQKLLENFCVINKDGKDLLIKATEKLKLSARSYFRLLKVSRTIADLEESEVILKNHVAEALQYRINE